MEIQVNRGLLSQGLGVVVGGASSRSTLPILTNVLIETIGQGGLKLTTTDLELTLSTQLDTKNQKEGSVAVSARKFYEIIRELPEEELLITVAKNNAVNIKTKKTYCRLVGLGKEDFPKPPEPPPTGAIEVDQAILKEALGLTQFSVSHDETRYVLNGVLVLVKDKHLKVVATDGRRLAYVERELLGSPEQNLEAIIPIKSIGELNKILSVGVVKISQNQNQLIFQTDRTQLTSRLIEGHFPNYEQVLPKEETTKAVVDRQLFLAAVKRAALFTSTEMQVVKFDFVRNKIIVSTHSNNLGEVKEEVDARIEGEDLSIGFNPQYLVDVLRNTEVEEVSLNLTKPDRPTLLKAGDGYRYVVMPMQVVV